MLAALRAWDPVLGLVVGSYQPGLQRGAAPPRAGGGEGDGDGEVAADGGAEGSVHEALGIYTHDVHRRWGSVFWRS